MELTGIEEVMDMQQCLGCECFISVDSQGLGIWCNECMEFEGQDLGGESG